VSPILSPIYKGGSPLGNLRKKRLREIIDLSEKALNSVYFMYDIAFKDYRLGTFSAIKEIEYAAPLGLNYYYLGNYIKKNSKMAYKIHFHPYEKYNWYDKKWHPEP